MGELDLVAKKGKTLDVYEVKCSYRIVKARKQVKKIKQYNKWKNANFFFYCAATGLIIEL